MRRVLLSILLLALTGPLAAQDVKLPNKDGSVKFAVLGDTGTGGSDQYAVGKQMMNFKAKFPFDFAIMLGDNLYGGESPRDYNKKFELPYKPLLDAKVKFYAALGNHDDPNQRMYKQFNMNGERYYSFKPSLTSNVRFFALDSNYMDPEAARVAGEGAGRQRLRLEDSLLPPSDVRVGNAWLGRDSQGPARAAVPEVRRQRRLHWGTSTSTSASSRRRGFSISSRAARRSCGRATSTPAVA